MLISAIVACDTNKLIGADNQIPWYLPADLAYFKKVTTGKPIIMGRKCFESIGRALPNRTNIVLTHNPFFVATGTIVAHNIAEAIDFAAQTGAEEAFIIGGGVLYEATIQLWDKLYLTRVEHQFEGDIYFPQLNADEWQRTETVLRASDEKNKWNCRFEVFERKNAKK